MRRRSSMFEVDLDLRKGRGDSIISIDNGNGSILDIQVCSRLPPSDHKIIIQRRRKNYENTYKTEPDEKPQMKLVRDTISEIINGEFKTGFKNGARSLTPSCGHILLFISVTCDGLEANHAFHMGLTTTLNSEVHARLKVCGETLISWPLQKQNDF